MIKIKYFVYRMFVWQVCIVVLALHIPLIFLACSDSAKNKVSSNVSQPKTSLSFHLPIIPVQLTQPKDRATYLVRHYWDNFDFMDTTYCHLPEITEQAFVDYLDVLPHAEPETVFASIKDLLLKAEQETSGTMLRYFLKTAKDYMYDPNSPLRNEDFYIPVTEYIIDSKSKHVDEAEKHRAKFDLVMMQKNRVGQISADFTYSLESGKTGTLHRIKSEYILLLFYNPDCQACGETIAYLKNSELLNALLNEHKLEVLAFYPDSDLGIWKKHLSDIPKTWLNAYDKYLHVRDKQLYDLKAIPTLYLLDKDKKIILKDVSVLQLEQWLSGSPNFLSDKS